MIRLNLLYKQYFPVLVLLALISAIGARNGIADELDIKEQGRIAGELYSASRESRQTHLLANNYPNMTEASAYEIQRELLQLKSAKDKLAGWKMGTVQTGVGATPFFAPLMAGDRLSNGDVLPDDRLIDGGLYVEAEVGIVLGKDLPGPGISREALVSSIKAVVGAVELAYPRVTPTSNSPFPPLAHLIADGGAQVAWLTSDKSPALDKTQVANETATLYINGKPASQGDASRIMEGDPLAALLWLANELPNHSAYLRENDIVITGSLVVPVRVGADSDVKVEFSSLGIITLK